MTRRPRLLLFALVCLTPVLIEVTLRYGENSWLVPAGLLPLLLLGPTRILPWSLLSAALFWIGLRALSAAAGNVELRAKWMTVRGLALLSLVGLGLVVAALSLMTLQWGIFIAGWSGAASLGWGLYLLYLTRDLPAESPGSVLLLRLWLLFILLPAFYALALGTLAGLCC